MGKIFIGQTDLTIQLKTFKNIANAQSVKIKYRKPNGILGEWTANIVDATNGIIDFNAFAGQVDIAGNWTIWAKIVDENGLISIGETATFLANKEII
jgi:hypothetical protein